MKSKILLSIIFVLAFCFQTFAQNTLDKMSVNIRMRAQRGQPEWRWTPTINFDVWGGLSNQVQFEVEYTLPTGKPFVKLTCQHNGRADDEYVQVQDCGNDLEGNSSTNLTGIFGFQIRMIDELNGINKVMYAGKFTVDKYLYNPAKQPQFAKNFYYFVNYDWRLTTAFISSYKEEYTPKQLQAELWIKADANEPGCEAFLFYKGKNIGKSSYGVNMSYGTEENDAVEFSRLHFRFQALFTKAEAENYQTWWKLHENPGEYEIKVLRKGELARTLKFNIGTDGKIVESNVGKEIKEGSNGTIVPVQLVGILDGTINQTILKSGWWGNPINGLSQ